MRKTCCLAVLVSFGMFLMECSGCNSFHAAAPPEPISGVTVKCVLSEESLGIAFKVGDKYGSFRLEIVNSSDKDLIVGNDMFLYAKERCAIVAGSPDATDNTSASSDPDRALMYASRSVLLTGVALSGDQAKQVSKYVYGANGQELHLDPTTAKDWKGAWDTLVPAHGNAVIAQQLMTWPGSGTGWVATPELKVKENGVPCRVLAELGEQSNAASFILPMTPKSLAEFAQDAARPMELREWAVGWLAALPDGQGWKAAGGFLEDTQAPLELRKSAARWLATRAPAEALSLVDQALWETQSPPDLQETCYYALTWSPQSETKQTYLQKAHDHPSEKIRKLSKEQ
mgnify:CR=1 FL=1